MTADILRVDESSTQAELAEALTNLAAYAVRQPHVFGDHEHPSRWDRAHARIDQLLADYETAPCA